ncbi:MAG: transposase [Alphaproteobacteria bacterium]|nr:transposase [Alphaproteobacteria bacterium]
MQERMECYRKTGESIQRYDQYKSMTVIRSEDECFRQFPVEAQRTPLNRLDKAFRAFFHRMKVGEKPGFPRFKSKHRGIHSFDIDDPTIRRRGQRYALSVKGIGDVRFAAMPARHVRQARIVRPALRTSIHLVVELPDAGCVTPSPPVGIDVGIRSRCALSTGEAHAGVRVDCRRIKRAQKLLSHARKASGNRAKKRQVLAKARARVPVSERQALHRLTRAITRKHNRIAVEDLKILNMVRNGKQSRSIHEQQWGRFVSQLTYKAERAGGELVRADPKRTSMTCSSCRHGQSMPPGRSRISLQRLRSCRRPRRQCSEEYPQPW